MIRYIALPLAAVVHSFAVSAHADTIYDNGVPDLQNAYHSDFDLSSPSDTVQAGDEFSLAQASTFGTLQWWGIYAFDNTPPAAESFTIRIFGMQDGSASSLALHEFNIGDSALRTDSGTSLGGYLTMFSYTASIPATNLAPGSYLLSIVANTSDWQSDWYWATSNAMAGNAQERDSDGSAWMTVNGGSQTLELAFNLGTAAAAIPEPGSISLVAFGGIGLLAVLRRRNAARR